MAQSISDAAQEPVISRRIRSDTQGERILWVDLTDKIEFGVGEVVHYSLQQKKGDRRGKSGR